MSPPKIYIVVLNYNGWIDTIECLESLLKLSYTKYQIIVVDNQSIDNSLLHIQEWAKGLQTITASEENELQHLFNPSINKPIPYVELTRKQAETEAVNVSDENLIMIQTGNNLGFAGGNNVALKYILQRADADYVWLLNNDTVVEPDSLTHLYAYQATVESRPIGITGAKVRYYYAPKLLQCVAGAYYNKWLAYSRQIGNQELDCGQFDTQLIKPDLIIGACMLVSCSFLKSVGLLSEAYFLYFEEQDWAERAKRKGFLLGYAHKAIIYHKEGATIGANQQRGSSSWSDFYFTRSKLLFTEKYFNITVQLAVKVSMILTLINRLRRGQIRRIPMLLSLIINPHRATPPMQKHK